MTSRNRIADRTIDVLLLFDDEHPVLSASDVSQRLGMPRSTTYRYLQSLRSHGLVEEDESSRGFRLGPRIFQLTRAARKGVSLSEVALPIMRELAARTAETVLLTRLSAHQVVCIERVDVVRHRLRITYERGTVLPLHAGATAKVLLAFMEPHEIESALASSPLPRYTEHTITDPDLLRSQLAAIRKAGYALTEGEVDPGVRGVAAPIMSDAGKIAGGLALVGPAFRLPDSELPRIVAAVCEAAGRISNRLRDVEG